jgi:tetratricopeptide (TPR) repeat protein
MERKLPQPVAALSSDNAAVLDRLVAMLDYAEGLTILFACCNTPLLRDQLIERARVRLAALGVEVRSLDFDGPVTNLRHQLRARVAAENAVERMTVAAQEETNVAVMAELSLREPRTPYGAAAKPVLFLTGLELSIPPGDAGARLLAELNLGRELFLRDAPYPLVFWLPDYAVTLVARHAPDFWAWRSGVFEFTLEDPHRREAYAHYVELDGDLATLGNLTGARKLQRQRILEGLLDDFRALPPQRATQEQLAEIQQELADLYWLQGKPQAAMALYQESLASAETLGDVQGIAVLQRKIADVLRQMGKPQEAMKLYAESLATIQALGDVRAIAVTQSKMADVLRQMGKPQEAMKLYAESLATIQALGDVRAIAVTQANFGQFLLQEGTARDAVAMLWAAFAALERAGYAADAATLRDWLTDIKHDTLGPDRFDALWSTAIGGAQPDWLAAPPQHPPHDAPDA